MVLWLAEKPIQQAAWGHMLVIPALKAQELLHIPGQPGIHGDSLSQNNQKKSNQQQITQQWTKSKKRTQVRTINSFGGQDSLEKGHQE